jgi:hypothetical protein
MALVEVEPLPAPASCQTIPALARAQHSIRSELAKLLTGLFLLLYGFLYGLSDPLSIGRVNGSLQRPARFLQQPHGFLRTSIASRSSFRDCRRSGRALLTS